MKAGGGGGGRVSVSRLRSSTVHSVGFLCVAFFFATAATSSMVSFKGLKIHFEFGPASLKKEEEEEGGNISAARWLAGWLTGEVKGRGGGRTSREINFLSFPSFRNYPFVRSFAAVVRRRRPTQRPTPLSPICHFLIFFALQPRGKKESIKIISFSERGIGEEQAVEGQKETCRC